MSLSSFRSENWGQLTPEQRLAELQEVENNLAAEQGRDPREVIKQHYEPHRDEQGEIDGITLGQYGRSEEHPEGAIYINEDVLTRDDCSYECLETVIHEGRHAYQDDHSENKEWNHNMRGGYQDPEQEGTDRVDYRFQPVEADANNYADAKMAEYSGEFQGDAAHNDYSYNRNLNNYADRKVAIEKYGENYEQEIQAKVEAQYQENNQGLQSPQNSEELAMPKGNDENRTSVREQMKENNPDWKMSEAPQEQQETAMEDRTSKRDELNNIRDDGQGQ